jgi:hypothetical protein
MHETLQEFSDSRGTALRVEASAGVIHGVKVLGLESRNGRTYLPQALEMAPTLYEGVKVNVNHPRGGPQAPRGYEERLGSIRHVTFRAGEGLFGDLHFNPRHALAEQLVWDATHAPENVGLSHNVQARTGSRGGKTVVEAILCVHSVDLVADPATTRGLFESRETTTQVRAGHDGGATAGLPSSESAVLYPSAEISSKALATLTLEELRIARPDLIEAALAEHQQDAARLQQELDELRTADELSRRRQMARRLLAEYRLPDPDAAAGAESVLVSEEFMASLVALDSERAMRETVAARARLVTAAVSLASDGATDHSPSRPLARDQSLVDEPWALPIDASRNGRSGAAAAFARSIS